MRILRRLQQSVFGQVPIEALKGKPQVSVLGTQHEPVLREDLGGPLTPFRPVEVRLDLLELEVAGPIEAVGAEPHIATVGQARNGS